MLENILLFDIDKTIFNTEACGKRIIEKVGKALQITTDETERVINNYKRKLETTTDFNPDDFIKEASKEIGVDSSLVNQAVFLPDNFVLYPETVEILEILKKRGNLLGVYSEGVLEWQKKKIVLTDLINYFDPSLLIIERRKLSQETISRLPSRATIVDDKKEVIETLKRLRPDLNLIWLNRKDNETLDEVRTIRSLSDLI